MRAIPAAAFVLMITCGCAGRASHVEWRVQAIRAEMRVVLPQASEKLACDSRRLETDVIEEVGTQRTYAVRGCGRSASYICETGVRSEDGMPDRTECVDTRSRQAL